MRIKRLFLRLLGFELFAPEVIKLVFQGVRGLQTDLEHKLAAGIRRGLVLLALLILLGWALFFGLLGLALYLNVLMGNPYQGFWLVSGGCWAGFLLALLLRR